MIAPTGPGTGPGVAVTFHLPDLARAAHLIAVAACLGNKNWTASVTEELELQLMAALEEYHMRGNRERLAHRSAAHCKGTSA